MSYGSSHGVTLVQGVVCVVCMLCIGKIMGKADPDLTWLFKFSLP